MRRMRKKRWGPLLCSQLVAVQSGEAEVQGRRCWSHGRPRGFRHGTVRLGNTHGRDHRCRDNSGITSLGTTISQIILAL